MNSIVSFKPLDDLKLLCKLVNGETKIVDVSTYFEPESISTLKNKKIFMQVIDNKYFVSWLNEKLI